MSTQDPGAPPPDEEPGEWSAIQPSEKEMGLVRLTLDRGVRTTAIGQLYGMDFEIDGDGFSMRVFFDYYNRRLKVIRYRATDYRPLVERLTWLARENGFDKVFVKARKSDWRKWLALGFVLEGIIRYYFCGEDAYVLSRYGSVKRLQSPHLLEENELIASLMALPRAYEPPPLPPDYRLAPAGEDDIPQLVGLYRSVFRTYPSPLTHPDYIQQTMRRHVVYRAVWNEQGEIVSAASAEIDVEDKNAELTDCATMPSERGRGLMFYLLRALEGDLRERNVTTGYTLARAVSAGMNRVFYRLGYEFTGRLLNNCDIAGDYEDMNIWVRRL